MSSLKPCPYAEKCYRRNPIHFGEYSHHHLDVIYQKGRDSKTQEYSIPQHLLSNVDILQDQLKLLEKLNANQKKVVSKNDLSASLQSTNSLEKKTEELPTTSKRLAPSSPISETKNSQRKPKESTRKIEDYISVVAEKGKMAEKLLKAAPYNIFFTAITDSTKTHTQPLTITFQEIFDSSLGEVESSVQINFMVDIGWLLGHYYFANIIHRPLLVLYGSETDELKNISKYKPNVTTRFIQLGAFATAHSKIMIISYTDGSMRLVISTANLYEDDWENRTQGLWMSPRLPPLSDKADTTAGESCTNFRHDFILYLSMYKLPQLETYINRIRRTNFSEINVYFIGSVPGSHRKSMNGNHSWGHPKVSNILQKHCPAIDDRIPVVCQSSSIGFLGPNIESWIQQDFLNSMRRDCNKLGIRRFPPFKMIYPSLANVKNSHDNLLGGGCLPYSKATNDRQPWLQDYLHQWRSNNLYRSKAMPHIKSYARFNLSDQSIYWFLLTSANLSKAAWGCYNKTLQPSLRILNYEAGVLFIPKILTGEETFPLGHERKNVPPLPLPYDVPLTPYASDDTPFLSDYLSFLD